MSTRRTILTGLAAMPLGAVPSLATDPDPILAAIEAHQMANALWWKAVEAYGLIEEELSRKGPTGSWNTQERLRFYNAEDQAYKTGETASDAWAALLGARATTLRGALALVSYAVRDENVRSDHRVARKLFETIEVHLRALADGQAAPDTTFSGTPTA